MEFTNYWNPRLWRILLSYVSVGLVFKLFAVCFIWRVLIRLIILRHNLILKVMLTNYRTGVVRKLPFKLSIIQWRQSADIGILLKASLVIINILCMRCLIWEYDSCIIISFLMTSCSSGKELMLLLILEHHRLTWCH
jgi:hypothetical protein